MFPVSSSTVPIWCFFHLSVIMSVFRCGCCQSPPRLLPEAFDVERVVPEGAAIQLPCPVEGDPDTLFFEWYRDKEPLDTFGEERYRVQSNGLLRIKSVLPEDTGLYVCRAVNGFGSVEVKVTLLVLGKPDTSLPAPAIGHDVLDISDHINDEDEEENESKEETRLTDTVDIIQRGKPRLVQVSKGQGSLVQRMVGSSISFKCAARGDPKPQISWLKNGKPLPDSNLPSNSKKGHWTLYLQNLQVSDTGNYTCHVYNGFGSVAASFLLHVADTVRKSPQILGIHPMNGSITEDQKAVIQCHVKSEAPPHIQWLKEVKISQFGKESNLNNTVRVQGEYFRVLKWTEVTPKPDGSYMNKLTLDHVRTSDAGKYICMAANKMGYTFRSAHLTVISRKEFEESTSNTAASSTGVAFPLVIAIAVGVAVVVAVVVFVCVRCRGSKNRRPTTPSSRITSSSKASVSTETKNSYSCMAYSPHLGVFESNVVASGINVPGRVYIPPSQVHRIEPIAFV